MKRNLTVVFPVYQDNDIFYILMGKKAPGTKLAGIRNGCGGKCEVGETPLDCAVREASEEMSFELEKEKLILAGSMLENEKEIFFYLYFFDKKIDVADNQDFVDIRWFDVKKYEEYIQEMFPGNIRLILEVIKVLENINNFQPFLLDESNNQELIEKSKEIY